MKNSLTKIQDFISKLENDNCLNGTSESVVRLQAGKNPKGRPTKDLKYYNGFCLNDTPTTCINARNSHCRNTRCSHNR